MPSWEEAVSEEGRWQLVHYVKSFSRRFTRAKEVPPVIEIGPRVALSAESIEKGKTLFKEIECFKCHGNAGRADGPSAPDLEDDLEFPIRPANLSKPWNFRGGHKPEDIYTRLQGGLAGTPMPSFSDSLDNEQTWHLINYIVSLWPNESGAIPPLKVVLTARRVDGEIPTAPSDEFWQGQESFSYPLVGQVIEDPRWFTPSIDMIEVQAVYNENELAFRLVWDDPTESEPDPDEELYGDAVAVQLPVEPQEGTKRPFFLMGDEKLAVHLLRWSMEGRASEGIVTEINGRGLDTLTPQPASQVQATAHAQYQDGQYQVVIKRPLLTDDRQDLQLEPGRFLPIAFFAWDGSNGEIGSQMAISHWYYFLLEPTTPTTVYIYPLVGVILAAGVQWWMIRRLRQQQG